jgi:hypothetical protein
MPCEISSTNAPTRNFSRGLPIFDALVREDPEGEDGSREITGDLQWQRLGTAWSILPVATVAS